jgi:NitT/TauT family transport system substrate-binding protein
MIKHLRSHLAAAALFAATAFSAPAAQAQQKSEISLSAPAAA